MNFFLKRRSSLCFAPERALFSRIFPAMKSSQVAIFGSNVALFPPFSSNTYPSFSPSQNHARLLDGAAFVEFAAKDTRGEREREKCEILFLLCAEKIERAGERKKYPIGLDWIGKIFGPLSPLWLIWKTPPSFLRRRRRRRRKKNE